jgi:hypothetical protein
MGNRRMNILIACEFSARVREAFTRKGHIAVSCDLLPSEYPGYHFQGDIRKILYCYKWDMLIAFPPCTYLCNANSKNWKYYREEQEQAKLFFQMLYYAPIPKIAIENPVGIMSQLIKPSQVIHPWQYGHTTKKRTCLWLRNLPLLQPTCIINLRSNEIHMEKPSRERSKNRSRTFTGIAAAMASQWG